MAEDRALQRCNSSADMNQKSGPMATSALRHFYEIQERVIKRVKKILKTRR